MLAARFGPELVVHGGFDSSDGWTPGTGWAIGSGVATATASTANLDRALAGVKQFSNYQLRFTITAYTGGNVRLGITTAGALSNVTGLFSSAGDFSLVVSVLSSGIDGVRIDAGTSFTGSVDNVSVREVLR
jgi:hypothetical protein